MASEVCMGKCMFKGWTVRSAKCKPKKNNYCICVLNAHVVLGDSMSTFSLVLIALAAG